MITIKEFYRSMGFEYRDSHSSNAYEAMILSGGFCIKIERLSLNEIKVIMIADNDLHKRIENISSRLESNFTIRNTHDPLRVEDLNGEWLHKAIQRNAWKLLGRCYNMACRDSKLELIGI